MKLEQLSFADLIALKEELHELILGCYKNGYLALAGKKKDGPNNEQLRIMAVDFSQKFDKVKEEIDRRISIIEF